MTEFTELIREERQRQERKWGEQNHDPEKWTVILMEEIGEMAKMILELGKLKGQPLAKDLLEDELIQCAAVLKAMWESGKRNGWL